MLSNKAKLQGLSRSKIIAVLAMTGFLVIIAVLFGIFDVFDVNNDTNAQINNNNLVNTDNNFNSGYSVEMVNHILQEAEQAKSANLEELEFNKNLQSTTNNESGLEVLNYEVPPINELNSIVIKQEEVHAKQKFKLKKISDKYNSYSSKSLIYKNTDIINLSDEPKTDVTNMIEHNDINMDNTQAKIFENITDENNNSKNINKLKVKNNTYLNSEIHSSISPYELKAGSVIPSTMINGLNSELPGEIVAQVRQNVYDSVSRRYLLIPQGSKLIGLYDSNISYGQERALVAWNRLIYPDGSSINLKAMPGTDLEGYAGFHDQVDNHYIKVFGASFIIGVISAAMQYSQNNITANNSNYVVAPNSIQSVAQTLTNSLGQQLGQTGLAITQKNLNVQPVLMIRPNYPFNIILTADMILKPYGVLNK